MNTEDRKKLIRIHDRMASQSHHDMTRAEVKTEITYALAELKRMLDPELLSQEPTLHASLQVEEDGDYAILDEDGDRTEYLSPATWSPDQLESIAEHMRWKKNAPSKETETRLLAKIDILRSALESVRHIVVSSAKGEKNLILRDVVDNAIERAKV